jgi:hypothetical protein
MEDMSRCFSVAAWPPLSTPVVDNYDDIVRRISTICWDRYEGDDDEHRRRRRIRRRHSLYVGSLGPCAYVRYRLAKSSSSSRPLGGGNDSDRRRGIASLPPLLVDAARAVDLVLGSHPPPTTTSTSGVDERITLLEGERVGALALSAAICLALGDIAGSSRAKNELLDVGARIVADDDAPSSSLPASECEVLYGRCGYLQAIAFVRSETDDGGYGGHVVLRIARAVLEEGERTAAAAAAAGAAVGGDLPLLWRWHGKAYLGAIHGVVGVLFALRCFPREVSSVEGAMGRIRTTIAMLDGHCHASGNLRPTVLLGVSSSRTPGGGGERDDDDRLVHLCHGAPGHVLLLAKAYEVFDDVTFLERAEDIARGVLCRRGLLRKGTVPSPFVYISFIPANRSEARAQA